MPHKKQQPKNTLGGLSKPKQAKSVIGLFRRESSGSGSAHGVTDSETSIQLTGTGSSATITAPIGITIDKKNRRSASIPGVPLFDEGGVDPLGAMKGLNHGQFPVATTVVTGGNGAVAGSVGHHHHRRANRRGSMLELSG